MGDDAGQPDWGLLPNQPQRFFELPAGFDRRTLKRAYNRLIRRYKPETHPDEFQRVRAAFEQLDQMLRYGGDAVGADPSTASQADWETPGGADGTETLLDDRAPDAEAEPPPQQLELYQRVAQESPAAIYAEIERQPVKSPYDYFALAVLSDVCGPDDGLRFARWLLEGMRTHPSDGHLARLFQAYLRGPLPAGARQGLLIEAAEAIHRDAFYPITEAAWDALLRDETLDVFVETLRRCEAQLRDVGITGKMVFYIRMLRPAQWRAASAGPAAAAWVAEALDFVESNFEHIPDEFEFEVDLLAYSQEYQQRRGEFVAGSELRGRLDRTLEAYFCLEPPAGDGAFIEEQLRIALDAATLLDAFPVGAQDASAAAFFPLWEYASVEVATRALPEQRDDEIDYQLWAGRARALLVQLEAKSDGSNTGQFWNFSGLLLRLAQGAAYIGIFTVVFTLVITTVLALEYARDVSALLVGVPLGVGVGVFAAFFAGRLCSRLLLDRVYHPFCQRMAKRCYRVLWRRDTLDLLGRSRLPFRVFRDLVAHQATDQISTSHWVSSLVSGDYALAMYALAQRHVV